MPNIRSNLSPKCARGYIYDADTQLYYCQSRYYDPATGRFLNADAFASTGQGILGSNMFTYCGNNPVLYFDIAGYRYECSINRYVLGKRDTSTPYTSVVDGTKDIYIVNKGEAKHLLEELDNITDYVVVEDLRNNPGNANMKIYNSYLITDSVVQQEILSVLVEYNATYPATQAWTREVYEMEYEWDYHNIFASLGFNLGQTGHVDLDMEDKNKSVFQKGVEFLWQKIT